jgi:hypothetical protein
MRSFISLLSSLYPSFWYLPSSWCQPSSISCIQHITTLLGFIEHSSDEKLEPIKRRHFWLNGNVMARWRTFVVAFLVVFFLVVVFFLATAFFFGLVVFLAATVFFLVVYSPIEA